MKNDIAEHFSQRAAIYNESGTWVNNDRILSSITSCLPIEQNHLDIIDLGSGTGAVANYIFNNYSNINSMVAVDICKDMLECIDNPQIGKVLASLDKLPFRDNTFDAAVSRQCLHYIENLEKTISEIRRVIKKRGVFILSQIVPLESSSKSYWEKVIRFRQPLRCSFSSESEWIYLFTQAGFQLSSIQRLSTRSSLKKWAKKYAIKDSNKIKEYKDLLLDAPREFLVEYNIEENGEDVFYDSFWFIAKFYC